MSTLKTLKQLKPGDVVVYTDGRRREVKAVLPARQRGYIIVQFKDGGENEGGLAMNQMRVESRRSPFDRTNALLESIKGRVISESTDFGAMIRDVAGVPVEKLHGAYADGGEAYLEMGNSNVKIIGKEDLAAAGVKAQQVVDFVYDELEKAVKRLPAEDQKMLQRMGNWFAARGAVLPTDIVFVRTKKVSKKDGEGVLMRDTEQRLGHTETWVGAKELEKVGLTADSLIAWIQKHGGK